LVLGAGFAMGWLAAGYAKLGSSRRAPDAGMESVRRAFMAGADSLDVALVGLAAALDSAQHTAHGGMQVRRAFRASRRRYKRIEALVEFYAPALAAALNSRRQEVDDDDAPPPSTLAPSGFPALESTIWPAADAARAGEGRRLVEGMRPVVARLRTTALAVAATDAQLIELGRAEVARVATLGIAGFDTPRTRAAMAESAEALEGVADLFAGSGAARWPSIPGELRALDTTLVRAAAYLRRHGEFDSFDRLAFIAGYVRPAARAIDDVRRRARVVPMQMRRAWRADAASVYDAGAFDPLDYAPSGTPAPTPALVALGQRLFFDPMLSGTGTRACASCHMPARAFSDGVERAPRIDGHGRVARNTPGLFNAALQPAQFADARAVTLEDQSLVVLGSASEMASGAGEAAATLSRSDDYRRAFAAAFGGDRERAVTPLRVRQALAAFERTLVRLDSRFDRAARGDATALNAEERAGFNLFMGKALCGTCHFAPLFSGNTPPLYVASDVEVIGTPVSPARAASLDPDSGRARVDHLPLHLRAFKTPTLRNVSLTAPYMHNGAFRTLEEVVRFYDVGGGRGAGATIGNQTLAPDSLHLSAAERRAIVAFLNCLTDTAGAVARIAPS
jgi:cytochrome c peroxidase